MEWIVIVALAIGALIVFVPVAFVLYLNLAGFIQAQQEPGTARGFGKVWSSLTCSVDTDCPPGYVCSDGQCVLFEQ